MSRDLVALLKSLGVAKQGDFVLSGGDSSNVYFDIKKAYGDPAALNLLCDSMLELIDPAVTCLAASGYGGIPLAAVAAAKSGRKLSLIRDSVREHGTMSSIEGYVPDKWDCVGVIDDVFTTGGSIKKIISGLEPTGAKILESYVVLKRANAYIGLPVKNILTPDDFA